MLNLTPSASLLNPGGALLVCRIPAFWVCVLVVICFCATGVAVFGAVIQTDSWITFKEEVVWLGGLAGHLTFRNEVFSYVSWALPCLGRKKRDFLKHPRGGKQTVQLKFWLDPSSCGDRWSLACELPSWAAHVCVFGTKRGKRAAVFPCASG